MIEIRNVQAVVTDIEGTTSSLAFVKEELFPYARSHLADYVCSHQPQLGAIAAEINAAAGQNHLSAQQMIDTLLRWMDEDRKVTPLKTLQGMIWRAGYESGQLTGHIYADAARVLRRWHADGLRIYVYSSGSIDAQKLLFSHTREGDLTPIISGYFDTTTGPKLEVRSYEKILEALHLPGPYVLFLSDSPGETAAAGAAGMQTVLLAREGSVSDRGAVAVTFDAIALRGDGAQARE